MAMDKFRIFRMVSMAIIFVAYRWNAPATPPKETAHRQVAGSSVGWKAQKGDKNGKDVVFSHSLPPVTTAISVSIISGFGFSLGFGLSLGFGISRSLSKVVITVSPGVGVSVISTPTVSVVSKTISVSVGTVSVVS